ncbi:MAG: flagellar assembly protein FliW [Firmicutes bacterium]|nr:flagellar assembly protein FliW [Bacillota bacterium]
MVLNTDRFGEIVVDAEKIITFPSGILGFEKYKRYILLHEKNSIFSFLQCIDEPELAFVVIMPELIKPDYHVTLEAKHVQDLKLEDAKDGSVYGIVTIPENVADMTINLQAPLVINNKQKLGKQVVLTDSDYRIRHNVLAELQKSKFEQEKKWKLKEVRSQSV